MFCNDLGGSEMRSPFSVDLPPPPPPSISHFFRRYTRPRTSVALVDFFFCGSFWSANTPATLLEETQHKQEGALETQQLKG